MYELEELSIELTNECDLACIHCSSGSVPNRLPNELSFDKHLELVLEARALGATVLSLSGGNPLMYEQLPEIIGVAKEVGYERILLYTTGHSCRGHAIYSTTGRTVMDYQRLSELLGIGVTWVFSLHSHVPAVNDMIMNTPGALADIKASIKYLTSIKEVVELHCVPMLPNWKHLRGVRSLAGDLGVRKVSFLRFVPQTRGKLNSDKLLYSKEDFKEMQHMLHEMSEEPGVPIRMGCPIDFRHTIADMGGKVRYCHAGDDLILVRPTGAVHPCAAWKSLPADSNVKKQNLTDIWHNSEVFNAIREFKAGGYHEVENGCKTCGFLDSCMSGCPAQRLHHIGAKDISALKHSPGDPMCPLVGG